MVNRGLSQGLWGVLAAPFDDDSAVDIASLRSEVESFASSWARRPARSLPATLVLLLDQQLAALPRD